MRIDASRVRRFAPLRACCLCACIAFGLVPSVAAATETRTGAVDCKNSEQAAQHINSCGKATVAAPEAPAHE